MRKVYMACVAVFVFINTYAQSTTVYDSVVTGNGNSQQVYYQLSTGSKSSVSNVDWHLAISIRPTQYPNAPLGGTSIRINEANGVHVYYVGDGNAAAFSTFDTTGWQSWPQLHDSDIQLDLGAFNSNRNTGNIFDFGWGIYNSTSHNVVGDSLYIVQLPNGEAKKFLVVNLDKDTAFNIQYSNLDNSNMQYVHVSKRDYQGKEFVYLNMDNNAVSDREPEANAWDMLFIKYAATDVVQEGVAAKTGIWINSGDSVNKVINADVNSDAGTGVYSAALNAIGWNWQQYDSVSQVYNVQDSLVYFIKTTNGNIYKIIFTGYNGPNATGTISFSKKLVYQNATGIEEAGITIQPEIYPNPAGSALTIVNPTPVNGGHIRLTDLSGRMVLDEPASGPLTQLNTLVIPNGIYIITIQGAATTYNNRVVVSH